MPRVNKERVALLKEFIRDYRSDNDRFPSFSEMQAGMNYSSRQTLQADIKRLKEEGFLIADDAGRLTFSSAAGDVKGIATSVVGSVRCGSPTEAHEEIEGFVILPTVIFGADKNLVLLKAKGDSMKGKQIVDGDLLVVRKQPTANVGEIVIALLDSGETTCKTLRKDNNGNYYLEAANNDYSDIWPEGTWCIYGVVRHAIHNFA